MHRPLWCRKRSSFISAEKSKHRTSSHNCAMCLVKNRLCRGEVGGGNVKAFFFVNFTVQQPRFFVQAPALGFGFGFGLSLSLHATGIMSSGRWFADVIHRSCHPRWLPFSLLFPSLVLTPFLHHLYPFHLVSDGRASCVCAIIYAGKSVDPHRPCGRTPCSFQLRLTNVNNKTSKNCSMEKNAKFQKFMYGKKHVIICCYGQINSSSIIR